MGRRRAATRIDPRRRPHGPHRQRSARRGILRIDVERSAALVTAPVDKKRSIGLDLNAMRAAIAAAMVRSKREIPHYYLEHQVDVTGCEEFLSWLNAERQPDNRLLMGALAVKAVALAARRFPTFNGFYEEGQFKPSSGVHAGVAIAIRGGGLASPAIHASDQLTLDALMARMRDLIQRVRSGRIRSSNGQLDNPAWESAAWRRFSE